LNQVKTKVTDDFGKMLQQLSSTPAPLLDTSDLADIKKSIADIKKNHPHRLLKSQHHQRFVWSPHPH
jgi:hypothetical protein